MDSLAGLAGLAAQMICIAEEETLIENVSIPFKRKSERQEEGQANFLTS